MVHTAVVPVVCSTRQHLLLGVASAAAAVLGWGRVMLPRVSWGSKGYQGRALALDEGKEPEIRRLSSIIV